MFSCFSRDDVEQEAKMKKRAVRANSLLKNKKETDTIMRKTNIAEKQQIARIKSKPVIVYNQIKDEETIKQSYTEIRVKDFHNISKMENIFDQINNETNTQNQRTDTDQEYQSSKNSITSFGVVFQQSAPDITHQILMVVSELSKPANFNPKLCENSLVGLQKKIQNQDDEPNAEELSQISINSTNINGNLNQEFSKFVIDEKYEEAFEIFRRMSSAQKNENDVQGFSPLYLATLMSILRQRQALNLLKKLLKDHQIVPTKKSSLRSKPIQQAILFKSIPTLTHLFRATYLYKIQQIKKSLKSIAQALIKIPDLYMEIDAKVGSFIPLLDQLTPDDTIKIYKSGANLRIDYTLVGYTFLQSKRRKMSCCLQKLEGGDYTILGINHDKQCYADLLEHLDNQQLVLIIQDLLSIQIKRTNPKIIDAQIKKDLNIFSEVIRQHMVCGVSTKYQILVKYNSQTQKLKPNSMNAHTDLSYLKNWKNYTSYHPPYEVRKKKKELKLGVWLCQSTPISLQQMLEMMRFLSFAYEGGEIIYSFLADKSLQEKIKGFPMKMQIPINFSLFLDIKINELKLETPEVEFNFTSRYPKQKRCSYQKTLIRREKRSALIKLYT